MTNLPVAWPSQESAANGGSPGLIMIDAALEVQGAVTLQADLLQLLGEATGDQQIAIELTDVGSTAIALQIAAALRSSLIQRGRFGGLGQNAARALDRGPYSSGDAA